MLDRVQRSPRPYLWFAAGIGLIVLPLLADGWLFTGPPPPLPVQEAIPTSTTLDGVATQSGASSRAPQLVPPESGEDEDRFRRDLPSHQRLVDAGCDEPVPVEPPGADLAARVAAAEPGTCFTLASGQYSFSDVVPKDLMTFLGAGRSDVIVVGTGSTESAFSGTAHGVTIARMTFRQFRGTGGEKLQEQAPIRGTAGLWLSDRGQMATDWLIEDVEASGNVANGVFLGDFFTVRGGLFSDNGIAGLGGSELIGGLIERNVVSGNGADQATGALVNGGGMKFTRAGTPEAPLVVSQNEVFANTKIGIWCDIGCDGFEVLNNFIHDHESRAVMIELSRNAHIADNLVVDSNTWTDFSRDFNASAITIAESAGVTVEGNYIDGAEAGIIVRQTRRPALPSEAFLQDYEGVNYVAGDVVVRGNSLLNTKAMGISTGATGNGIITDIGSIRFESNNYADGPAVTFWWDGGRRYSYDDWLASGRDGGGSVAVGQRPAWPAEAE